MRGIRFVASAILTSLLILGMTAWGALALHYSSLPENLRTTAAFLFPFFGLAMLLLYVLKRVKSAIFVFTGAMVALLAYWQTIEPRQDRDWAPEYARLAHATITGDRVTVYDISELRLPDGDGLPSIPATILSHGRSF